MVDTDTGFNVVSTQMCDDIIDGVHMAHELVPKRTKADGARYLGSAPLLVCQIWAKECGYAPGTRGFAEYAHKQLTSGAYSKFKAWLT